MPCPRANRAFLSGLLNLVAMGVSASSSLKCVGGGEAHINHRVGTLVLLTQRQRSSHNFSFELAVIKTGLDATGAYTVRDNIALAG